MQKNWKDSQFFKKLKHIRVNRAVYLSAIIVLLSISVVLIITAVNNRDYPVVQGGTIFLAITFSLCMLIVDLLYAAVDPRIKAQYEGQNKKKIKKEAEA